MPILFSLFSRCSLFSPQQLTQGCLPSFLCLLLFQNRNRSQSRGGSSRRYTHFLLRIHIHGRRRDYGRELIGFSVPPKSKPKLSSRAEKLSSRAYQVFGCVCSPLPKSKWVESSEYLFLLHENST